MLVAHGEFSFMNGVETVVEASCLSCIVYSKIRCILLALFV